MNETPARAGEEGRWHARRRTYTPARPVDAILVPLLASSIEGFIAAQTPPPGHKALDVGCGNQPFREILESRGYRYFSMDPAADGSRPVDYRLAIDADLSDEVVADGPFDLVVCTEVLEHVASWDQAFRNFSRVLAPGGKVLVTCPHFYPLHEEPFDFWRPTRHAIAHFARINGLQVHEFRHLGSGLDVLGTLLGNIYFERTRAGLWTFIGFWMCKAVRRVLFAVLERGSIQKRVASTGCYLANFAVLAHSPDSK